MGDAPEPQRGSAASRRVQGSSLALSLAGRRPHTSPPRDGRRRGTDHQLHLGDHAPRQCEQDGLAQLGKVARLTTPDLWDSITAAIFHHFGRAKQGAALYRRWCATFGRSHETFAGPLAMPPTAPTVLHLSDQGFDAIRIRLYKPLLRAAARAYVDNADEWQALEPDRLFKALCGVRRLGEWTAAAAVADYTGDFFLYPHTDRAMRTRARRAH